MLTTAAWILVCIHILLGACDTIIHHELTEKLAWRRSQARELRLHAARNFAYAGIFLILGFTELTGALAALLLAALYAELAITLWDFVEEDRTRALPPTERVLHTLLALNYGAILAMVSPGLVAASAQTTGAVVEAQWFWAIPCMAASVGTLVFGLRDLGAAQRWTRIPERPAASLLAAAPRRSGILVTGGTGFIGSRLVAALVARGDDVTVLTRDVAKACHLAAPVRLVTSLDQLHASTRIDAIVNLAGQPVAGFFWTGRYRRRLLRSRLRVTRDVLRLIARLDRKPGVLVSGSAIGVYGANPDGALSEEAVIADDGSFSQRLCQTWERMALRAETLGVRTVLLRTGLVLDTDGGSLPQMLPAFEYGAGGPFGRGRNWMSWISRDDLVRLIDHAIRTDSLRGPLNGAAPEPVRNIDFARTLGAALSRPAILPLPATLLTLALGDLAREIFLGSQRVEPEAALRTGFRFRDDRLDPLLCRLTGSRRSGRGSARHTPREAALNS